MKLEGEIGEIKLVEHLVDFGRQNFTGAIRFENDGIIKILYFKGGDILSASTNDRADSVDEILMRANKVSRDHVKQALAKRKESETLGDALLNLGFITRKELQWARRVQVIGVIRSITNWSAGSFTIVADYLPKREEGTLFPLQQIIVELLVTEPDRGKVERQLDSGDAVFAKSPEFESAFRRLGLNEDADAIVAQINGARSAADIAGLTGKDPFNSYKLLHALATLGLLSRAPSAGAPKSVPSFEDDFAAAGVADAADMWQAPPAPVPEASPEFSTPPESEYTPPPPVFAPPPPAIERPAPIEDVPIQSRARMNFDSGERPIAAPIPEPMAAPPRRAGRAQSVPPITPKPVESPGGHRWTGLIAVIVLAILAFAGYSGWMWWQARQRAPVIAQPAAAPPTPAPAVTTSSPPPETVTTTTSPAEEEPLIVTATGPPPTSPNLGTVSPSQSGLKPAPTSTPPPKKPQTAAPVQPASSDAVRARYDAMARGFASNVTGNFTIQVALVCQTVSITKALEASSTNVWFVPTSYRGQPCYRLFWGRYETREAAQRALSQIPDSLSSGATPVVIGVPRNG